MPELLNIQPSRPLTDRECTKLLRGLLGALLVMTDFQTVQKSVDWWQANLSQLKGMLQ